MDRHSAILSLTSERSFDRLRAARRLAKCATPLDLPELGRALATENDAWVRAALRDAISFVHNRASLEDRQADAPDALDPEAANELRAEAVEDVTRRLVHEVEPILGRLRVYAQRDIALFAESRTRKELDKLEALLTAIDRLSRAASAPVLSEFDFATAVAEAAEPYSEAGRTIARSGPEPLTVIGDRVLVQMILDNGLRNAIEATSGLSMATGLSSVIVTWGATDRDFFCSILDRGMGLPTAIHKIFEIGSTTKKGHLGMGLALARQAARTVRGQLSVAPRRDGGVSFDFRWPRPLSGTE